MLKKLLAAVVSVLLLCILSGCDTFLFSSVDNLMRPPKISGEVNSQLMEAFESSIGLKYSLKYPLSGEYQSPCVMYDMDNDGTDEAIIFYSPENESTTVRMAFFDYSEEKWNIVSDFKGLGNSINQIDFEDIKNDGSVQVVISWGFFDTKTASILSIYNVGFSQDNIINSVQLIFDEPYSAMKIFDVDGSGSKEIFLISSLTSNENVKKIGTLYAVRSDGSIASVSSVTMDSTVSGYSSIKLEPATENKPYRIFVDALKGDISMSTEIIYWDSKINGLSSPLLNTDTQSVTSTVRSIRIESRDINGDGLIETPLQVPLSGSYTTSSSLKAEASAGDISSAVTLDTPATASVFLTKWCTFSADNKFVPVAYAAINSSDYYVFNFKTEWLDKITIENDVENRVWTFYEISKSDSSLGDKLFSIATIPSLDWSEEKYSDYVKIAENNSLVYAAKIFNSAKAYGITSDVIIQQFEIIE